MNSLSTLKCAAVLVVSFFLSSCALMYQDLEEPGIQLVSVTPQQISFSGVKLLCRVRIDNPNDVSLPVKGGKFALEAEDMPVAHGALADEFTVAARDSELVDVIVDLDSASSIALAIQLFSSGAPELQYALTGHVDIAISVLGRVRFDERGVVPLTVSTGRRRDGKTSI